MANYLKRKLYIVNLSSIISSSLWKTSNNIFDIVEKCNYDNWIIFFDEFDALAKVRNDDKDHWELKRIASSIIQILDFINDDLIFIAATNHIDLIDKAIVRRFSKRIDFEMPSKTYIKKYISKTLKELNMTMDNSLVSEISEIYKWKSYAEIKEDLTFRIKKYIIEISKKWEFQWEIKSEILKY
jgi:AAA+ superfamily predicted ATPase